eukprot:4246077-Amphidinium_carterae.1
MDLINGWVVVAMQTESSLGGGFESDRFCRAIGSVTPMDLIFGWAVVAMQTKTSLGSFAKCLDLTDGWVVVAMQTESSFG